MDVFEQAKKDLHDDPSVSDRAKRRILHCADKQIDAIAIDHGLSDFEAAGIVMDLHLCYLMGKTDATKEATLRSIQRHKETKATS